MQIEVDSRVITGSKKILLTGHQVVLILLDGTQENGRCILWTTFMQDFYIL
jgi:hypothetical protein